MEMPIPRIKGHLCSLACTRYRRGARNLRNTSSVFHAWQSGAACIGDAYTLDELMNCDAISITSRFVDPLPLMGFPGAAVDSEGAQRVLLGKTLDHADISLIRTDAAYGSQTDENLMVFFMRIPLLPCTIVMMCPVL